MASVQEYLTRFNIGAVFTAQEGFFPPGQQGAER
jgi:hypothetical protein